MQSTYSIKEVLHLMLVLDLQGLEILQRLIVDESNEYSKIDYLRLLEALEYFIEEEKKGLL